MWLSQIKLLPWIIITIKKKLIFFYYRVRDYLLRTRLLSIISDITYILEFFGVIFHWNKLQKMNFSSLADVKIHTLSSDVQRPWKKFLKKLILKINFNVRTLWANWHDWKSHRENCQKLPLTHIWRLIFSEKYAKYLHGHSLKCALWMYHWLDINLFSHLSAIIEWISAAVQCYFNICHSSSFTFMYHTLQIKSNTKIISQWESTEFVLYIKCATLILSHIEVIPEK